MAIIFLSGILASLALPTAFGSFQFPNLGYFAWICLVPLYLGLRLRGQKASGFGGGFFFGVSYYGISLYWFFIALNRYGGVPFWGSLLGWAVVVAVQSLFLGVGISIAAFLSRKFSLWIVFPLAWVVQDFARSYFPFGGFPWAGLAYTQKSFLSLLQILDVTGIAGLNFILVLTNVMVAEFFLRVRERKGPFPLRLTLCWIFMMTMTFLYGGWRLHQVRQDLVSRETRRVALVQGNIAQDQKWQEENGAVILNRHLALSEEAEKKNPDLLVWPEAAYPEAIPADTNPLISVESLKKPLLTGVVTYEGPIPDPWPPLEEVSDFALFNSAFLIQPGGEVISRYDKHHLVPMGEYLPLRSLLFAFSGLEKIVSDFGTFTPGREWTLMKVDAFKFGVTMCYEDLFPVISRIFTKAGADFLVNLTNDAWYERSSAVFQHFDFSRYRAIENRRAMVRATNTGVSGVFSPTGEVIAMAPVFEEAVLTADVPLGGVSSFYTRFGDVFAWGCVLLLGLLVGSFFYAQRN